jgi:hypothetical protein
MLTLLFLRVIVVVSTLCHRHRCSCAVVQPSRHHSSYWHLGISFFRFYIHVSIFFYCVNYFSANFYVVTQTFTTVIGCPANTNLRQKSSSKSKSGAHLKLRVAHLLVKSSSYLMLASPARRHARAAQLNILLPERQRRQSIGATSVDFPRSSVPKNNRQYSLLKVSSNQR